jgi:hypothetical protein
MNKTLANEDALMKSTLSLNFGMGFQTHIYKNFYLNVEPIFKYHFQPYSKAIGFNPFTISLTGGMEYKF